MKNFLVLSFTLIITCSVMAQNIYVNASIGYAFGIHAQNGFLVDEHTESYSDLTTSSFQTYVNSENIPFSLGKGITGGVTLGYMINSKVGVEIQTSYLKGEETNSIRTFYDEDKFIGGIRNITWGSTKTKYYSNMWRFIPSVKITPGFEKFNPYLKLGAAMGLGEFHHETITDNTGSGPNQPSPYHGTMKTRYYGGIAWGFNGVFGVSYALGKKWDLLLEMQYLTMSYSPKYSEIYEETLFGEDILHLTSVYGKETKYVDKLSYNSGQVNKNEPAERIKESFPFSSFGMNFGISKSF